MCLPAWFFGCRAYRTSAAMMMNSAAPNGTPIAQFSTEPNRCCAHVPTSARKRPTKPTVPDDDDTEERQHGARRGEDAQVVEEGEQEQEQRSHTGHGETHGKAPYSQNQQATAMAAATRKRTGDSMVQSAACRIALTARCSQPQPARKPAISHPSHWPAASRWWA